MSNKVIPESHEITNLRLKLVEEFRQILNDMKGYPIGRQGDNP
ncbi:hypothetical protein [Clostridium massiliamazoniense]|nr:hypothetical protein [Clostridium massiliamazoniense]